MAKPFTPEEIAAIEARYPTEGAVKLAAEVGRRRENIIGKARGLGLRCELGHPWSPVNWTPEMDGVIRAEWQRVQMRSNGLNAARLAKRLGVSRLQLLDRAARIGVSARYVRQPGWTEAEDELLRQLRHFSLATIREKMRAAGYQRTENAISSRIGKLRCRLSDSDEVYSANQLAALMGVSTVKVGNWIKRGELKAKPRTDTADHRNGGVADRWMISRAAVRSLLIDYTAQVDISRADKFWLVDLLAGDRPRKLHMQDSCGAGYMAEAVL